MALLIPTNQTCRRPMDVGHVYAIAWLFHRWYFAAVPGPTSLYECASCLLGKHERFTDERRFRSLAS